MYIWVGCRLPQVFEDRLRKICREENKDLGVDEIAFHLPQHISLKISFDAGAAWEAVLSWLKSWCAEQSRFSVRLRSPELVPGVLWIPVEENETLQRLHRELDQELEERFGITPHPFDLDFRFHSTLFLDTEEKLGPIYPRLKALEFPEALSIDAFLLGISPDNSRGSHHIVAEIGL